jgi:hypothetical protein
VSADDGSARLAIVINSCGGAASAVALGEGARIFLFRVFIEYPVALMCLMDKDE